MKNRSLLYGGLVLGIAIAISVPFIFKDRAESINQTINLTASLISTFASLLTFIIAIFLFNRYGIDSSLIEKSSSKVFQLLEQIKETYFSVAGEKFGFWIKMSDPFRFTPSIEAHYSEKLIFSEDYIYGLEKLFEISNNPFIPKPIADKVDNLQFSLISYDVSEVDQKNYSKVSVVKFKRSDNPKFGRFNMKDLTLFEFLTILDEINDEVKNWIKNNSSTPLNLNL